MNLYMDRKRDKRARIIREIVNYAIIIILALALAFCFVYFLFQATTVVGDSMSPTLTDNDKVVIMRSAYIFSKPKRYDVIKFKIKKTENEHEYVKRVVGLPKEKLQIRDGSIYIDGKKLTDVPFDDLIVSAGIADEEIELGEDEYFVIGDNCNNSEDSRFTNVGTVTSEEIEGKIIFKLNGFKIVRIE